MDLAATLDAQGERTGMVLATLGAVLVADLDRDVTDTGLEAVERVDDGAAGHVGDFFGGTAVEEGDEDVHVGWSGWNAQTIGFPGQVDKPKVWTSGFEKSEVSGRGGGYPPLAMEWLNFHHLRYFYVVARDGSIAKASQALHVSQPSISTQLRLLERALGEKLLARQGRGLALTDMGRLVYGYAEQIFGLGRELLDTVRDRPTGLPPRVQVGIADVVPKGLAFRLLQPLLVGAEPVRLVVREDRPERLLAELAVYQVDLVIADTPAVAGARVKAFSHPLGVSEFAVFGTDRMARRLRRKFPASLQGQPFVLPLDDSQLRHEFAAWLRTAGLGVDVRAEVEDSALATTFAVAGVGLMLAPVVLAADLRRRGLVSLGVLPDLRCRYYALTVERRVRNPAVARLLDAARANLFAS